MNKYKTIPKVSSGNYLQINMFSSLWVNILRPYPIYSILKFIVRVYIVLLYNNSITLLNLLYYLIGTNN